MHEFLGVRAIGGGCDPHLLDGVRGRIDGGGDAGEHFLLFDVSGDDVFLGESKGLEDLEILGVLVFRTDDDFTGFLKSVINFLLREANGISGIFHALIHLDSHTSLAGIFLQGASKVHGVLDAGRGFLELIHHIADSRPGDSQRAEHMEQGFADLIADMT